MADPKVPLNVRVRRDALARFDAAAHAAGLTRTQAVADALRDWLAHHERP